jgi:hypothetical protein
MILDRCNPLNPGEQDTVRAVWSLSEAKALLWCLEWDGVEATGPEAKSLVEGLRRATERIDGDEEASAFAVEMERRSGGRERYEVVRVSRWSGDRIAHPGYMEARRSSLLAKGGVSA